MNLNLTITLTTNEIIAIIGLLFTLLCTFFTYKQYEYLIKERNNRNILKKHFDSELFGIEVINLSTYCYVVPNCTNIDPSSEAEPKHLLTIKGDMFSVFDEYLQYETQKDDAIRHILILADSGMGKTSFLLNYYAYNLKKAKKKQLRIVLVPLGIPNTIEYIDKIQNIEETVIFLDAFDEDTKAINNYQDRLALLMEKCKKCKRIVLTCRTQFFLSDEEIPVETGILKVGPRKAGDKGIFKFYKLYISPLSDSQVYQYLKKRFKWNVKKRKKALLLIKKIPNLKVRPMLLANIPEIVNKDQREIQHSYQLYEIMVNNWLKREERWIENSEDLRQFSERLAFDLYLNRNKRHSEIIPYNELTVLAKEWNIPLENWQLTGRSLLNRDAKGNYKFAHRSIMEFLFVVRFFKLNVKKRPIINWTDQQKVFASQSILIYNSDPLHADFKDCENLPEWIVIGLDSKGQYSKERLISFIKMASKTSSNINLSNANLSYAKLKNVILSNVNLSYSTLRGADLSFANLKGANLEGSQLEDANLTNAILEGSCLKKANLKGAILKGANLNDAMLTGANLERTIVEGAKLNSAKLEGAILNESNFTKADLGYAKLDCARIEKAIFFDVDFKGSSLIGAKLNNSNLTYANFDYANLEHAIFSGANLKGANLSRCKLGYTNFESANFSEADLKNIDLSNSIIDKANFEKAKSLPVWIKQKLKSTITFS